MKQAYNLVVYGPGDQLVSVLLEHTEQLSGSGSGEFVTVEHVCEDALQQLADRLVLVELREDLVEQPVDDRQLLEVVELVGANCMRTDAHTWGRPPRAA